MNSLKDNIDARITLSSLLVEDDKVDEAVSLLSSPKSSGKLFLYIILISLDIMLFSFTFVTCLLFCIQASADCTAHLKHVELSSWWLDGRIKMQLAKIYQRRGMLQEFVDTILLPVRQSLLIEAMNEKVHKYFAAS